MKNLIALIDIAWEHKKELYDVDPNSCIGYFDFRNKVVKTKFDEKEVA
ncbi:hypothetical protein [Paraclostridium dentum]